MTAEQSNLIEELYMTMFDMLRAYASTLLKEPSLAEEAVQETFHIACKKPEQLFESPNPKGWLVNTLKFTIKNIKHNLESTRQLLTKYTVVQSKDITFSEDSIRLELMYEDLADTEEFNLLKEMAIDGKSHLEMASVRGISVSACKKRVQRAKEKLKEKMLL